MVSKLHTEQFKSWEECTAWLNNFVAKIAHKWPLLQIIHFKKLTLSFSTRLSKINQLKMCAIAGLQEHHSREQWSITGNITILTTRIWNTQKFRCWKYDGKILVGRDFGDWSSSQGRTNFKVLSGTSGSQVSKFCLLPLLSKSPRGKMHLSVQLISRRTQFGCI